MLKIMQRFLRSEDAATAIEYGMIAAFIVLAIIASIGALGQDISTTFYSRLAALF